MNRRRFLQYTIALAGAAVAAQLPASAGDTTGPIGWSPTPAEVADWLEYYKLAVQGGCRSFNEAVLAAFQIPDPTIEQTVQELEHYREAEAAWRQLESDRQGVAVAQGLGYEAGRRGEPRFNPRYQGPSNQAYGWYNYWELGDRDRRGERLPRSPGVSWPTGKRPFDRFA